MLSEMLAELEFSNSLKASSYLDMHLHSDSSLTPPLYCRYGEDGHRPP